MEIIAAFMTGLVAWLARGWMTILVYCAPLDLTRNSIRSTIAAFAGLVVGAAALVALGFQIQSKGTNVTE